MVPGEQSFQSCIGFLFLTLPRHFVNLLDSKNNVEDDLAPELEHSPGTTTGTKFSVLHRIFFPSLVRCGFWPPAHSLVYPCFSQSLPNDKTAGVSSNNCTVTKRSRSWTYYLCFLVSFALHHWPLPPLWESPFQLSSKPFCSACASTLWSQLRILALLAFSTRVPTLPRLRQKSVTHHFPLFEFKDILCQVPSFLCGRIAPVWGFRLAFFLEFWRPRTSLLRFAF